MHIVLVCREFIDSVRSGGIGSYMEEMAKAYVSLGHKVTIVTASDDTSKETSCTQNGYDIIRLSGGDFFCEGIEKGSKIKKLRFLYRFFSFRKHLRQVINKIPKVDIVEVADYGAEGLFLMDLKVPIIIRLHTPQSLSRDNLKRIYPKLSDYRRFIQLKAEEKIFNKAQYITSCSDSLLDWTRENFKINPAICHVIKNPISLFKYSQDNALYDKLSIFYAGTISETKGVGDLIEACKILHEEGFSISLNLAGKGGSYSNKISKDLENKGINWCHFLGKLTREDVANYFCTSTVCVFPSWWENMPMVILEAMSRGAIVISTDSGGTGEIINDGIDGFLVAPKNPNELAKAIKKAIGLSSEEREIISKNAKEKIIAYFSPDYIASQQIAFYNKVIKHHNKQ